MTTTSITHDLSDRIAIPSLPKKQSHLPFLDGIRAIMALWVAFGHSFQDYINVAAHHTGNANYLSQPFFRQAFYAHFAVDVFIVLSGFCLMLPVAKDRGFRFSRGWKQYLVRRAWRILPPYYAAILLALSLSLLRWRITRNVSHMRWEAVAIQHVDFRFSAILSHIFLVQNTWNPWAQAIDGPTWSVATEFQIYLLFPLLLLPLWRHIKPVVVIPIACLIGVGVYFGTKSHFCHTYSGLTACSWYVGLFAMGMWGSEMYVRRKLRDLRPSIVLCGVGSVAAATVLVVRYNWMPDQMWALDLIVGAGTAFLLVFFSSYASELDKPLVMRLLERRPLVFLGTFSYSFYLIHAPLLNVAVTLLLMRNATPLVGAITIAASLMTIVFLAWVFFQCVERPAMERRSA